MFSSCDDSVWAPFSLKYSFSTSSLTYYYVYLERNESVLLGDEREVWSRHNPGDGLPADDDMLGICLLLA